MRKSILACVALTLCFHAQQADAQKRPARRAAPRVKPAPKPDPVNILLASVSRNSLLPGEDLYAACQRSSFKALAWGLEGVKDKIALEKSEFETDAEFAERRGKLEGLINPGGDVIVCQPLDDNEDAPFRYDAEREVFLGSFKGHQNVWRDVKKTGSYVSRTRMGVRATITSSLQIEYDVDMDAELRARSSKCLKSDYRSFSYEAPVARASAAQLKAGGYLVFAGKLVSPVHLGGRYRRVADPGRSA